MAERVKAVLAEADGDPYGLDFAALANVTDAAPGSHTADYYGGCAPPTRAAHVRRSALRLLSEPEAERIS